MPTIRKTAIEAEVWEVDSRLTFVTRPPNSLQWKAVVQLSPSELDRWIGTGPTPSDAILSALHAAKKADHQS